MKKVKWIVIGFLIATCMFLMMGASGISLGSSPYSPLYVKIVS